MIILDRGRLDGAALRGQVKAHIPISVKIELEFILFFGISGSRNILTLEDAEPVNVEPVAHQANAVGAYGDLTLHIPENVAGNIPCLLIDIGLCPAIGRAGKIRQLRPDLIQEG